MEVSVMPVRLFLFLLHSEGAIPDAGMTRLLGFMIRMRPGDARLALLGYMIGINWSNPGCNSRRQVRQRFGSENWCAHSTCSIRPFPTPGPVLGLGQGFNHGDSFSRCDGAS